MRAAFTAVGARPGDGGAAVEALQRAAVGDAAGLENRHLIAEPDDVLDLRDGVDHQTYGIGLKELWDIPAEQHEPGLVLHGSGWPLDKSTHGGWFLYHAENQQVVVGLIMDLSYRNPWLSPFDEFQRMKHHPVLKRHLEGGSLLGAARHHGLIPWDTKDADLSVYSHDYPRIEAVLRELMRLKLVSHWHVNTDGVTRLDHRKHLSKAAFALRPTTPLVLLQNASELDRKSGFGYHISMPKSRFYIDLWLMGPVPGLDDSYVTCTGYRGGCWRWWASGWARGVGVG